MKCKECGSEMRLDDRDYHFKGNYDNYWLCDCCNTGCIESYRYARSFKESWSIEKNGVRKEYTVHKVKGVKPLYTGKKGSSFYCKLDLPTQENRHPAALPFVPICKKT